MTERLNFEATINGQRVGPIDIPADLMLMDFLHEYLNLTGTRGACQQGVCRACNVLFDEPGGRSRTLPACITGVLWAHGRTLRTIEGIAGRDAEGNPIPTPIQQAYLDHFSFQCSFCTPGFVMSATALIEELERNPVPSAEVEGRIIAAMNENICRCTGYIRYLEGVRAVILSTPGLTLDAIASDTRQS